MINENLATLVPYIPANSKPRLPALLTYLHNKYEGRSTIMVCCNPIDGSTEVGMYRGGLKAAIKINHYTFNDLTLQEQRKYVAGVIRSCKYTLRSQLKSNWYKSWQEHKYALDMITCQIGQLSGNGLVYGNSIIVAHDSGKIFRYCKINSLGFTVWPCGRVVFFKDSTKYKFTGK